MKTVSAVSLKVTGSGSVWAPGRTDSTRTAAVSREKRLRTGWARAEIGVKGHLSRSESSWAAGLSATWPGGTARGFYGRKGAVSAAGSDACVWRIIGEDCPGRLGLSLHLLSSHTVTCVILASFLNRSLLSGPGLILILHSDLLRKTYVKSCLLSLNARTWVTSTRLCGLCAKVPFSSGANCRSGGSFTGAHFPGGCPCECYTEAARSMNSHFKAP